MDFIFDPSLVLYLPLQELDGASFMSKDACGHLCTVTGALWRPHGRYFDGTDDVIKANTVTDNSLFDGAHTIIAWVKLNKWGANQEIVAAAREGVAATHYSLFVIDSANKFNAATNDIGQNIVTTTATYTDDTGHHFLAMMVDADGHINHFIVDDTDIGSDSTNTNDLSTVSAFWLGQLPFTSANVNPFGGTISEAWVYGRELTVLEIENIRLATKWRYR